MQALNDLAAPDRRSKPLSCGFCVTIRNRVVLPESFVLEAFSAPSGRAPQDRSRDLTSLNETGKRNVDATGRSLVKAPVRRQSSVIPEFFRLGGKEGSTSIGEGWGMPDG
jgi:hypothetical protein